MPRVVDGPCWDLAGWETRSGEAVSARTVCWGSVAVAAGPGAVGVGGAADTADEAARSS